MLAPLWLLLLLLWDGADAGRIFSRGGGTISFGSFGHDDGYSGSVDNDNSAFLRLQEVEDLGADANPAALEDQIKNYHPSDDDFDFSQSFEDYGEEWEAEDVHAGGGGAETGEVAPGAGESEESDEKTSEENSDEEDRAAEDTDLTQESGDDNDIVSVSGKSEKSDDADDATAT